jgi:hypothetical protein
VDGAMVSAGLLPVKAGVNQQPPVHLNISNGWMMDEWMDGWMMIKYITLFHWVPVPLTNYGG